MPIIFLFLISFFSIFIFDIFPVNILISTIGCLFSVIWYYNIYDRAQCVYRDWNTTLAQYEILKEKRKTILEEILKQINKYSEWEKELVSIVASSSSSTFWLQERFPKELQTLSNQKVYFNKLSIIENQINSMKELNAKLAGQLYKMKMDQFFGICVPSFINFEEHKNKLTNDLLKNKSI
jgi:hypothetical protein